MREALDVGESGFELGKDLQYSFGVMLGAQTSGDLMSVRVGTAHKSNWFKRNHEEESPVYSGFLVFSGGNGFSIGLRGSIWSRIAVSYTKLATITAACF